jgi:hypothetical protein
MADGQFVLIGSKINANAGKERGRNDSRSNSSANPGIMAFHKQNTKLQLFAPSLGQVKSPAPGRKMTRPGRVYGVVELKVNDPSASPFANVMLCGVLLKTLPDLVAVTLYVPAFRVVPVA